MWPAKLVSPDDHKTQMTQLYLKFQAYSTIFRQHPFMKLNDNS